MPRMRITRSGTLLVSALLVVAAVTALTAPGLAVDLAPFFVLIGLYLVGRFPGEEIIERLRERYQRLAPRLRSPSRPLPRAPFVRPVGRAAAFALAVRPPPALLHR
jgi:uncharacterized membrane protein YccC